MELYLLEENRTIVSVTGAAKLGLYQLSGAVKVGSTWYLGSSQGNNSFQIFRVEGNRLVRVRMYPLRNASRSRGMLRSELTRNERGDAAYRQRRQGEARDAGVDLAALPKEELS